ncbi:MAG: oligosaccharide flippase family protein [Prevotellaceae bacterium]|nr:oligosaccharide flippase family protein [Prevotellaceae bacterium]
MANKNTLLKNTIYLYVMTFSSYFFSLITLPYETRILGPEAFGLLGFASAFYMYFYLILDFGFILSATKKVAENSHNRIELSKILSCVTYLKLFIFIFLTVITLIICSSVENLKGKTLIITLYLVHACVVSIIPDYLYRGLEKMKMITYRTLIVRTIFTCMIFIFLKKPDHYILVPIFHIVGNIIALIIILYDVKKNLKISFVSVNGSYAIPLIKDSAHYFFSRIASTIYSATNTVILGFVYPTGFTLGYYTTADKVRGLASQTASPIADSFYPYMLRTKNYNKLVMVTCLLEVIVIIAGVILYFISEDFCTLVFGKEYIDVAPILRWMIPLMVLILPTYMFGFPALSSIGAAKWANYSVEFATLNQIIGMVLLYILGEITVKSVICLTTLSESICLFTRVVVFFTQKPR